MTVSGAADARALSVFGEKKKKLREHGAPAVVWRLAQWAPRRWRECYQTTGHFLLGEIESTTSPPGDEPSKNMALSRQTLPPPPR